MDESLQLNHDFLSNGNYKINSKIKLKPNPNGLLFMALELSTGTHVTIKQMKVKFNENLKNEKFMIEKLLNDLIDLKFLNHKNINRVHDFFIMNMLPNFNYDMLQVIIINEYSSFSLKNFILNYSNGIPKHLIKDFLNQIMNGINYCHDRGKFHLNLKPQNILLFNGDDNNGYSLKITDFHINYLNDDNESYLNSKGTNKFNYMAPEILSNKLSYDSKADVWSIGCIFYEMITSDMLIKGDFPFSKNDYYEEILKIFHYSDDKNNVDYSRIEGISPQNFKIYNNKSIMTDEKLLLQQMLIVEPEYRISIPDIMKHPYLSNGSNEIKLEIDKFKNLIQMQYNDIMMMRDQQISQEILQQLHQKLEYTIKNLEQRLMKLEQKFKAQQKLCEAEQQKLKEELFELKQRFNEQNHELIIQQKLFIEEQEKLGHEIFELQQQFRENQKKYDNNLLLLN
eukprot:jgi/Orpsp1_1/1175360/evm.model.c7180000053544.1